MCPIRLHPSNKHLAYFLYQGEYQLIFYRKQGPVKEILNKSFQLVDKMLRCYSKVAAIFLQLHQVQYTSDNKLLTRMAQKLKKALRKHYQCKVSYFWVREQCHADSQHYHMLVMLSGHKCQQTKLVDKLVQEAWQSIHPDNFSFRIRNRIYRINRSKNDNELRALRMRISYMAKKEGKTEFTSYTNSYGCSYS